MTKRQKVEGSDILTQERSGSDLNTQVHVNSSQGGTGSNLDNQPAVNLSQGTTFVGFGHSRSIESSPMGIIRRGSPSGNPSSVVGSPSGNPSSIVGSLSGNPSSIVGSPSLSNNALPVSSPSGNASSVGSPLNDPVSIVGSPIGSPSGSLPYLSDDASSIDTQGSTQLGPFGSAVNLDNYAIIPSHMLSLVRTQIEDMLATVLEGGMNNHLSRKVFRVLRYKFHDCPAIVSEPGDQGICFNELYTRRDLVNTSMDLTRDTMPSDKTISFLNYTNKAGDLVIPDNIQDYTPEVRMKLKIHVDSFIYELDSEGLWDYTPESLLAEQNNLPSNDNTPGTGVGQSTSNIGTSSNMGRSGGNLGFMSLKDDLLHSEFFSNFIFIQSFYVNYNLSL